jgi:Family of unknown function (DUF5996)
VSWKTTSRPRDRCTRAIPSGSVEAAGSFDEVALSRALAEDRLPDACWGETPMIQPPSRSHAEVWPALPYGTWNDTCTTLHLWTQIVGKIRLAQTPWANHSWHVTLYVTPRGLTTSPIPYDGRAFQIDFDFVDHVLSIWTNDGGVKRLPLAPKPVADFHDQLMAALAEPKPGARVRACPRAR